MIPRKIITVDRMNGPTHKTSNKSEVPDNTNLPLKTNVVSRALMLFLAILSLIWVILPDPVPGFLDDILLLMSATVPLLKKSLGPG